MIDRHSGCTHLAAADRRPVQSSLESHKHRLLAAAAVVAAAELEDAVHRRHQADHTAERSKQPMLPR